MTAGSAAAADVAGAAAAAGQLVQDDLVSRPGSSVSLLRTVIGLYLRDSDGWLPASVLMAALAALDVPAPQARTALSRVKKGGVLTPQSRDGIPGFTLTSQAEAMLIRGDSRIHLARTMDRDDPWCLVSFSIPEAQRNVRHQLRRQLSAIGCGTVDAGLWICPAHLRGEVERILEELQLLDRAILFTSTQPVSGAELDKLVAQWWDLPALAALHRDFLSTHGHRKDAAVAADAETFAAYVTAVDAWRIIPYRDPGLPADLLPADWPGAESRGLFTEISRTHGEPSAAYLRQLNLTDRS